MAPVCPQSEEKYKKEQMSEDCLRLNIFVPANEFEELLPVLVFIHGGAFHLISGNPDFIYGPQLLIQHDIIIVTINYRLGALGFMSLGIEEASGNAGLKDILLALRWIKENIQKFGGNNNKITLGGNSSGASIVNYLLMTNRSSGLFHRVILLSGSAFSYRFMAKHAIENTMILAKQLCFETEDKEDLLKKFREIDVFDIINAQTKMKKENDNILRPFSPFVPTIENEYSHAVITRDPREILQSKGIQNVPIIAGFNYHEGIYMLAKSLRRPDQVVNILRKSIEMTIPSNIEYPLSSEKSINLGRSIAKFYFADENFSNWTLNNAIDLISDTQYIFNIDSWINSYKERNDSSRVYYYIFNFDGNLNWCKIYYNITYPGTSHADDLGYMFVTNVTKTKLKNIGTRDQRTINVMTSLVSNFVKRGTPTPDNSLNFLWPEYAEEKEMLYINDNPSVIKMFEPIKARLNFWYDVYKKYYLYVANGGQLENKNIP